MIGTVGYMHSYRNLTSGPHGASWSSRRTADAVARSRSYSIHGCSDLESGFCGTLCLEAISSSDLVSGFRGTLSLVAQGAELNFVELCPRA